VRWFERIINSDLEAKLTLCKTGCPVVLAHLYSYGKSVTNEMIANGYATSMSIKETAERCKMCFILF